MVSANPFMNLFQNILSFLFIDAFQVGHGEASLVQGIIQDREPRCFLPDLPSLLDILWKVSILEEGYDRGHLVACVQDCKGRNFFNARVFLDFHL